MGRIAINPIAGALGAEISGVDLGSWFSDDVLEQIRHALLQYGVIFFRGQVLTSEQQKALARRFGPIFVHPNFIGSGGDPEIVEIRRQPGDTAIIGEDWHSDTAMVKMPPKGAILYGIDVPPYGGDTLFANQYLAFSTLSPAMKRFLEQLRAVNTDRNVAGPRSGLNSRRSTKVRDDSSWVETTNVHPIVRTHPETRRKAIFVCRPYTVAIEGMSAAEGNAILEFLFEHCVRPEFTCRFRWTSGAVAIWDNRCTMHLAINDTGAFPRFMRRVQLAGDEPY